MSVLWTVLKLVVLYFIIAVPVAVALGKWLKRRSTYYPPAPPTPRGHVPKGYEPK